MANCDLCILPPIVSLQPLIILRQILDIISFITSEWWLWKIFKKISPNSCKYIGINMFFYHHYVYSQLSEISVKSLSRVFSVKFVTEIFKNLLFRSLELCFSWLTTLLSTTLILNRSSISVFFTNVMEMFWTFYH